MQQADINEFRNQLRGELIEPGDERYEQERKVYNAMIDRKPRMIARCADVADVIAALQFARKQHIQVSVRGGGHNAGGLGVWDDCLVIDLSPIKYVHVDPDTNMVRVGGGCTWGDVDHAMHAFGLAVPSGIISTTGVGGLTLGGGIGYLTRKFGLTIDNLLAADVVLADGSFVVASPDQNPDLFWAIRGGGGNFGVVTSFLFRAYPGADGMCRAHALAPRSGQGRDEVVSRFHRQRAGRTEWILRFSYRATRAPFSGIAALPEDVWNRLVLHRGA